MKICNYWQIMKKIVDECIWMEYNCTQSHFIRLIE